jgi:hypothetical protein
VYNREKEIFMAKSNKAQKRHSKKVARRKKLDKERNQRANRSHRRYRLDVKFEGNWKTYKFFKTAKQVNKHVEDTEEIRKRGDREIIEGRVVDMNTGGVVVTIPPSLPIGPSMLEAAKMAIEENRKIN